MEPEKKPFTTEFKTQAVAMVLAGKTIADASRELGISYQLLRSWMISAIPLTESAAPKIEDSKTNPDELFRLREELARLRRENDIIRKAAAYFARDIL